MLPRGRDTVASVLAAHAVRTPGASFLVTQDGAARQIRAYAEIQEYPLREGQ